MTTEPPPPPPRKRLSSTDLTGNLSASTIAGGLRDLLERIEGLETGAAKAEDVREVRDEMRDQRDELRMWRDEQREMRAEVRRALAAQTASSKSTAVWVRYGLSLLAAVGALAPVLSETLRSNPAALGPYGVFVVGLLAVIGQAAKKTKAEAMPPDPPPEGPPS